MVGIGGLARIAGFDHLVGDNGRCGIAVIVCVIFRGRGFLCEQDDQAQYRRQHQHTYRNAKENVGLFLLHRYHSISSILPGPGDTDRF